MEQPGQVQGRMEGQKFSSPEEELLFLREQVKEKERLLVEQGYTPERKQVASEAVRSYASTPQQEVLTETHALTDSEVEAIVLDIAPDDHDEAIADLLGIVQEKGIRNAIEVAEQLGNAHLEDDFHRFLVQYVAQGFPVDLKEREPLWNLLHMTLFEVALPEAEKNNAERPLKELISSMEQFYAGMISMDGEGGNQKHFTVELAVSHDKQELVMYVAVPNSKKDLFEKQVLSFFPRAIVHEQKNDYNIFVEGGVNQLAYAQFERDGLLPLKLYDEFDQDPLNALVNAFSKLIKEEEGAAVQYVVSPMTDRYVVRGKKVLEKLRGGKKLRDAFHETPETLSGEIVQAFKMFAKTAMQSKEDEARQKEKEHEIPKVVDDVSVEMINKKIGTPISGINIRVAISAKTSARAEELLSDIKSSFNQFENTSGNKIKWTQVAGRRLKEETKRFSYREYAPDEFIPVSTRELTTMVHFPLGLTSSPHLKISKAAEMPAPLDLPQEGTLLGINKYRDVETKVYMTPKDRLRHFYVIGQTGTGKTSILKNMIVQDIHAGSGVCMIDPHGSDIEDILAAVPEERAGDVIYFDPSHLDDVMGLNMLEFDPAYPEQKTFVVNELLAIFKKLYSGSPESMGPAFEQYFRNATMLVMEDPATGNTMLDISRVLADARFRELKLSRSQNPVVNQFWREIATKAQGEASLANIVPYITNKFDVFTANEIMRPIIAQETSAFRMREVMDTKKILLVNLSKGRLGDINANLIGLIIVGKILMAALSRVDSLGTDLPPFYLYIDEFQNITTDSIATILSEARKYGLSLTVAHQFLAQLEDKIRDAVFGNVGSMAAFRVGAEDAEKLESQFAPNVVPHDLMNIENYHAYVRILANGVPQKPFSIGTVKPFEGDRARTAYLKELSYKTYGKPKLAVQEEIKKRYNIGV